MHASEIASLHEPHLRPQKRQATASPPTGSRTSAALRSVLNVATLGLASLAGTCALAQGQPPPARREPPPEAFQACEGKTEGATVTLTMPDGKTLQGTCRLWKGALVAMPAGGPPSGGPVPSQ